MEKMWKVTGFETELFIRLKFISDLSFTENVITGKGRK